MKNNLTDLIASDFSCGDVADKLENGRGHIRKWMNNNKIS